MHLGSALDNRRFRSVLLAVAGIPITAEYLWRTVALPLVGGDVPVDFRDNYMPAAAKIAMGRDPYDLCLIQGCAGQAFRPLPVAGTQYVTPPPVAWMLQPLVGADFRLQVVFVVAVLQLSLLLFLFTALRAIQVSGWQMAALLVLLTLGFEPVIGNVDEGQINLVLLGLSGVWLLAWVSGDRWWGGAALGFGVALKLVQGPLGILVLWRRRWRTLVAAMLAGVTLLGIAVPQYLPEYMLKVLPAISAGTGLFENHSPGGTVARLFDPPSFLGGAFEPPLIARVITDVIAVAALIVTFWALKAARLDRAGRSVEAAAVVAVCPLVASYSWGTHLVLLLVPMFVLIAWSLPRGDWLILALVAVSWLCIGPVHKLMQELLVTGYSNLVVLRVLAESGVAGITSLWAATLIALRRSPSGDLRSPAANGLPQLGRLPGVNRLSGAAEKL